jgi:hypothetical protein
LASRASALNSIHRLSRFQMFSTSSESASTILRTSSASRGCRRRSHGRARWASAAKGSGRDHRYRHRLHACQLPAVPAHQRHIRSRSCTALNLPPRICSVRLPRR